MDDFPRRVSIDRCLQASDLRFFCNPCTNGRADTVCFRCGELGHWKNECLHWRTRMCWHHRNGYCERDDCPFSHSLTELRTPWKLRCVRIVKTDAGMRNVGCSSMMHTYRNCPHTAAPRRGEADA